MTPLTEEEQQAVEAFHQHQAEKAKEASRWSRTDILLWFGVLYIPFHVFVLPIIEHATR